MVVVVVLVDVDVELVVDDVVVAAVVVVVASGSADEHAVPMIARTANRLTIATVLLRFDLPITRPPSSVTAGYASKPMAAGLPHAGAGDAAAGRIHENHPDGKGAHD